MECKMTVTMLPLLWSMLGLLWAIFGIGLLRGMLRFARGISGDFKGILGLLARVCKL